MNVVERAKAPTPKFFRILRTVGLVLLAVSGSIVAAPVALPAVVVTVAGYAAVAGGVLSAVSQVTVDDDAKHEHEIANRLSKEILPFDKLRAGLAQDDNNLPRDGIK